MSDDIPLASTANDGTARPPNNGTSASSPTLNPRSCVTCRRRKVKCDKKQPCSNCGRARIQCIFPGPGRAPRKSRKPPDGELLDRLRRLEGVVQNLNAQVEEHEQEAVDRGRKESESETSGSGCPNRDSERGASVVVDNSVEGLETRFGRLVVDQGRSRYINNSFWASLNNEVEDLKSILIDHSDHEDDQKSPADNISSSHQGFIFGFNSSNVDMQALHPPPEHARQYWEIYKENVDHLVKVLHIPTFEPVLFDAIAYPEKVPKSLEPLMFAIYYGAVTSIASEECTEKWGDERQVLLSKYRFGLEQGLARANFLFCEEVVVLQALVVFLILLRRNDDARKIWTLTGLVVRIAQTLGIHRDGTHFDLAPFEIEMRRRLWWQVCILDARASEDHGCDPTIVEAQFDTKMPLNVNDTDLHPSMKEFPEERRGFTDMTFCLIRFEVTNIFRRILYVPPGPVGCNQFFATLTVPEKEKWISDCHQRLEDKYLSNCDMTIPLCWVTATISRLVMSKMWLIVYHPHQRKDGGASLPQSTKDRLFITSLENIEYSILLETEARTRKWGWLFRTYVQWHAIAFLLSELCVRTKGEAVERAWRALETSGSRSWFPLGDASPYARGRAGYLWRPLRKLLDKARTARKRELALERASQALKAGNASYLDMGVSQLSLPTPASDQPSSDNLDRMLRPVAPKLGEIPIASPPTWNENASRGNAEPVNLDFSLFDDLPAASPKSTDASGGSSNIVNGTLNGNKDMDALNRFNSLSEHGLDYLVGDVMEGYGTYGPLPDNGLNNTSMMNGDTNYLANPLGPQLDTRIQTTMPITNASGLPTASNATVFPSTTTSDVFPSTLNMNSFAQTAAHYGVEDSNGSPDAMGGSSGQSAESPLMEGENMDWAVWDDLVNQFGMEGLQQTQPPLNGAGALGRVHWF